MNSYLSNINNKESQDFIKKNKDLDTSQILLRYSSKTNLPLKDICEQIECLQKVSRKLPTVSESSLIYKKTALEQCSSEYTANHKISRIRGNRIFDLTGGLGIDSIFFSKVFNEVVYCEQNSELAEIAEFNFTQLGIKNIRVLKSDSISQLKNFENNYFDWIYADPARRNEERRSVDIKYYTPDIPGNLDLIFSKSKNILLKLAPAFDLKEAERIFNDINEFSVLSLNNECKEVLVYLSKEKSDLKISAVILNNDYQLAGISSETFEIELVDVEKDNFILDPDTAIKKTGLTNKLASVFSVNKISNHSDLLISNHQIENFPGRTFQINHVEIYNEKRIKKYIKEQKINKANISRSDFPLKPEEIKNRLKLKDGGNNYFFFTKNKNNNLIFISAYKH